MGGMLELRTIALKGPWESPREKAFGKGAENAWSRQKTGVPRLGEKTVPEREGPHLRGNSGETEAVQNLRG